MTLEPSPEPVLESDLPIVDPHHHLWSMPGAGRAAADDPPDATFGRRRYLSDELFADVGSGHDVRATVFIDAHAMYRTDGPSELRSVGEVEFVNGVAAMGASGAFGKSKVCAGIVGNADLRLGEAVRDVLEAHILAGGGRYRGVRNNVGFDEHRAELMRSFGASPHMLADPAFRAGFARLAPLGLSFDGWLLAPQLPELADLARAFPETQIVLNHLGGPVSHAGDKQAASDHAAVWRKNLVELAACPNVAVKLGGLGNPISGLTLSGPSEGWTSETLSTLWRPYVEPCIEAFGPERCMFESNFPVDRITASYRVVWNAFKRIAGGASASEKAALFSGTAARVYRLDI